MVWLESYDDELLECFDKLIAVQRSLEAQIRPIQVIINNVIKIQTRKVASYNDKRVQIITKVLPTDQWGTDMTDEDRIKIKDECITKTNELLGSDEDG